MIESPVLDRFAALVRRGDVLTVLQERFGPVPQEIIEMLERIEDPDVMETMVALSARSSGFEEFRTQLPKP